MGFLRIYPGTLDWLMVDCIEERLWLGIGFSKESVREVSTAYLDLDRVTKKPLGLDDLLVYYLRIIARMLIL